MGGSGPLPNPVGHTFPILTHDEQGEWRLIGTGFYVSPDGLFVTARHVVQDVLDQGGQVSPLAIFHLRGSFGPEEFLVRPVLQSWVGDSADIALGVAAEATNRVSGEVLSHLRWALSWNVPSVGGRVATYAFPDHALLKTETGQTIHFGPDLYPGSIQEVGDYRNQTMPYPYVQVDFRIHGAASGGPGVGPDGLVIGANCTEIVPDGPGYLTQICCLRDAYIEGVPAGETASRRITFAELVAMGTVEVRGHDAVGRHPHDGGRLISLDLPVTAPAPALSIRMYG
jgi:hypothetical protein